MFKANHKDTRTFFSIVDFERVLVCCVVSFILIVWMIFVILIIFIAFMITEKLEFGLHSEINLGMSHISILVLSAS